MHYPLGVRRVQRVGHWGEQGNSLGGLQAAALLQVFLEVVSVDQSHRKEQSAIRSLSRLIHGKDVRMVDRCRRARFTPKPAAEPGVRTQTSRNHFESNAPVKGELNSLVKLTHTSTPQQALYTEAS